MAKLIEIQSCLLIENNLPDGCELLTSCPFLEWHLPAEGAEPKPCCRNTPDGIYIDDVNDIADWCPLPDKAAEED